MEKPEECQCDVLLVLCFDQYQTSVRSSRGNALKAIEAWRETRNRMVSTNAMGTLFDTEYGIALEKVQAIWMEECPPTPQ